MGTPRAYRQSARAAATAQTRASIVAATIALAQRRLTIEITLDQVAERAGVTVQTVLRHFGSKDGLIAEALRTASAQVSDDRRVTPGDLDAAIAAVVAHYEVWGELMVRLVAGETSDDRIRTLTAEGKRVHRRWVEETFAPQLVGIEDAARTVDLLVVATDLQVWSLLRRDRDLGADLTAQRMRALVDGVLAVTAPPVPSGKAAS